MFALPDLPYPCDALSPYISARAMELHHGKHHQAYVTRLNELVVNTTFDGLGIDDVVRESFSHSLTEAIFNNAAQHWNHSFLWLSMKLDAGSIPASLETRIVTDFGSVEKFKAEFVKQGVSQFGAGWVWLVEKADGSLALLRTPNAVNPLIYEQKPLLGCDVWEHSYYLDYEDRRDDYLIDFIDHLIDWEKVAARAAADSRIAAVV